MFISYRASVNENKNENFLKENEKNRTRKWKIFALGTAYPYFYFKQVHPHQFFQTYPTPIFQHYL